MIICHVCNAECAETAELCPICGAQLQSEVQAEREDTDILVNPTLLTAFEDLISAEIFMDILKDNEIPFTSSSQMGETILQVTFGGGLVSEDIYVAEADFERANELYEEFLNSEADFGGEFVEEIEDEI